jgi:hypothetical protein
VWENKIGGKADRVDLDFNDRHADDHNLPGKKILRQTGALMLIDDSLENAIDLAKQDPPLRTILFGPYKWNRRESRSITDEDKLGYKERIASGLKIETEYDLDRLEGYARRANDWSEVVDLLS